jgi:hypothetical protein
MSLLTSCLKRDNTWVIHYISYIDMSSFEKSESTAPQVQEAYTSFVDLVEEIWIRV